LKTTTWLDVGIDAAVGSVVDLVPLWRPVLFGGHWRRQAPTRQDGVGGDPAGRQPELI